MRRIFDTEWQRAQEESAGNLEGRTLVFCGHDKTSDGILEEVDQSLINKWAETGNSLWNLNQIYYVGARTVQRCMSANNGKRKSKIHETAQSLNNREQKLKRVRAKLGKLVSEKERRAHKARLRGKLRRNFKELKLAGVSNKQLDVQIMQTKEVLKIRTQFKSLNKRAKYSRTNWLYKKRGVKSLERANKPKCDLPQANVSEFKAFWGSVLRI